MYNPLEVAKEAFVELIAKEIEKFHNESKFPDPPLFVLQVGHENDMKEDFSGPKIKTFTDIREAFDYWENLCMIFGNKKNILIL